MSERVDEIEKYYQPIETCDKLGGFLFWISAILSLLIPYKSVIDLPWLEDTVSIIFVLIVTLHSIFTHYNGFYLIPIAEGIRRKQLISNAFGAHLTPEQTQLYYNNEAPPSIIRLGANVLENTFFAKSICNEMAKTERIKVLIYGLVWLFAILNRSADLNFLLSLTQVLFSGELLMRWIRIEVLRVRNESIYGKLYDLFLNKGSRQTHNLTASILDSFSSYEAAKASASIKQSSQIFKRLNPMLSTEWNKTKILLKI